MGLLHHQRDAAPREYEKVISDYKQAIHRASKPAHAVLAYRQLGDLLRGLRRYSEAEQNLQAGLELARETGVTNLIPFIEDSFKKLSHEINSRISGRSHNE